MNILIAVPCMDQVAAGFAYSLAMLRKVGTCAVTFTIGSLIYDSRNKIAAQAIEMGADRVLWLDSDMTFTPDLLEKLNSALDEDESRQMVTGVYYRRTTPYTPVLFRDLKDNNSALEWEGYDDYPKDRVFEIAGCGFGCVLMKTDLLLEMAAEYQTWFDPMLKAGEDLAFCMRVHKLGHKIYCDPSVQCGHIGNIIVTSHFYESLKGSGKDESKSSRTMQ